jgi:oligoendopeptidase F
MNLIKGGKKMESKPRDLPKREEIPDQFKWNLTVIYPTLDAWEADFKKLKGMIEDLKKQENVFLNSATNLYETLQMKDQLGRVLDKLFVFARMHKDENNADSTYQALTNRIQSLAVEAGGALSFIVPALVRFPQEQLERYLSQLPDLRLYERVFHEINRQKQHILSANEEKLLAESGEIADAAGSIFGMLDNADIRFPSILDENEEEVELTKGRYSRFLESKDRRVRQDAFGALYDTYAKFRNTLGAMLNASVKTDIFYARARKFDSALQASLDDDNIPVAVYERLIEAVHRFLPSLNRYLKLRKQLLNLPDLNMYDLYAPLIPEYQRNVEYEEAKGMVLEALKPLGKEYCQLAARGFSEGWIDVCESIGKTSGAYAWGAYDTHPYILLNYQGKVHDVFTIAHEMGHALHSYYSNQNQPYIYSSYKIFVAEVASTVNEALLLNHMLAKSVDPKEKLYLINQWLEQFRTTLFRQTMFAEFEKITHGEVESGGALTADFFCERYLDLNKSYYGAETSINAPIAMEWSRIPHFYTAFYVYKYATGYSAATALSQMILNEGAPARERYLAFLKSGDSDDPLNLLRRAGVDMESSQPVEAALQVFDGLVTQMAELTGVKL